jgi:hypothetical protein
MSRKTFDLEDGTNGMILYYLGLRSATFNNNNNNNNIYLWHKHLQK